MEAERTTDSIDTANNLAMMENQYRVEQARKRIKPDQVKGADGKWETTECVDCDIVIPPARLEATGTTRCVGCQTNREKKR